MRAGARNQPHGPSESKADPGGSRLTRHVEPSIEDKRQASSPQLGRLKALGVRSWADLPFHLSKDSKLRTGASESMFVGITVTQSDLEEANTLLQSLRSS